jgi:hypothetical protein
LYSGLSTITTVTVLGLSLNIPIDSVSEINDTSLSFLANDGLNYIQNQGAKIYTTIISLPSEMANTISNIKGIPKEFKPIYDFLPQHEPKLSRVLLDSSSAGSINNTKLVHSSPLLNSYYPNLPSKYVPMLILPFMCILGQLLVLCSNIINCTYCFTQNIFS